MITDCATTSFSEKGCITTGRRSTTTLRSRSGCVQLARDRGTSWRHLRRKFRLISISLLAFFRILENPEPRKKRKPSVLKEGSA
jgi:hypothetical protein